ncbi:MAG: hypothetical protein M3R53_09865 [Candidatus Eremiobacteraeota bacterium]|nr:hypothetical protein [Candidatus Eremiobacteraeota bacterium]
MNPALPQHEKLHLKFESANCCVRAPAAAATSLRSIFARHLGTTADVDIDASIEIDGPQWMVSCGAVPENRVVLAEPSLLDVARSVVRVIERPLAARFDATIEKGIVLSLAGEAVVFDGAGDGDLFVLIAHLTARNWKVVATAASFVNRHGRLNGIQQLLSARSAMIPKVPVMYRGVIEMSPWYVAQKDIHFYAVEPARALGASVWSESARPRARVNIVPPTSFGPTLASIESRDSRDRDLRVAKLALGDPIATADLFETWWHAEVAGAVSA